MSPEKSGMVQGFPIRMGFIENNPICKTTLQQFQHHMPLHAYLLTGVKGIGKFTFAKILACALYCVSPVKPCKECSSCKNTLNGNNPDIIMILPEENKTIGVEKVRKVIGIASQHAYQNDYRIIIIQSAEKMTTPAQNCLLKLLEEPISKTIFILLANDITALLGTVVSRCIRIKLKAWSDEMIRDALIGFGYSEPNIIKVLPVVSGNIGQAQSILTENEKANDHRPFINKTLKMNKDSEVVSVSTGLKEDRENVEHYLNELEYAIHQALLVRTGLMSESTYMVFPTEWRKSVMAAPIESLTELMIAIFRARKLRDNRVNGQSSIDQLLIKILEERKKWQQSLV